jgi:hypothetical protein
MEPLADVDALDAEQADDAELLDDAVADAASEDAAETPAEGEAAEAEEPDPYLVESGKILMDLIELQKADALTLAIQRSGQQ